MVPNLFGLWPLTNRYLVKCPHHISDVYELFGFCVMFTTHSRSNMSNWYDCLIRTNQLWARTDILRDNSSSLSVPVRSNNSSQHLINQSLEVSWEHWLEKCLKSLQHQSQPARVCVCVCRCETKWVTKCVCVSEWAFVRYSGWVSLSLHVAWCECVSMCVCVSRLSLWEARC